MSLHHDSQFEKLYTEQRFADQRRAPSFGRTWQAAADRSWSPPLAAWCLPALTATAVLALAVSLWQNRPAADTIVVQAPAQITLVASVSDWVAPTDVLLETPSFSDEASPAATQP